MAIPASIAPETIPANGSQNVTPLRDRLRQQLEPAAVGDSLGSDSDLWPISPELILVAPPEVARRARELLPEYPPYGASAPERIAAPTSPAESVAADSTAENAPPSLDVPLVEAPSPRTRAFPRTVSVTLATIAVGAAGFVVGQHWDDEVTPEPAPFAAQVAPVAPAAPVGNIPAASTSNTGRAGHPTVSSSVTAVAAERPASARKATPANTADSFIPSRVFSWSAAPRATGYIVRFFHNGKKVIEARAVTPPFTLPASFRFAAGVYRWEVVPLLGRPANQRSGPPIVDSSFVLTAEAAANAGR